MNNTLKTPKPLKTFKCQSCGNETPSKKGRNKYCYECGIQQNKLESEWTRTEIAKEKKRIQLAQVRQSRMEEERLAFLAELQNEGYQPTNYAEERTHLEFMNNNGII